MAPTLSDIITPHPLIAVLTVDEAACAPHAARALWAGGISAIELTLRTDQAMDAFRAIKEEIPAMLVGAGTVLQPAQVDAVRRAGVDFAVSPGLNARVVHRAQELDLPFAPGILSPSDIEAALELDCRLMKFFPAESAGGLRYLRSISGPYRHLGIRFMSLGGIDADNLAEYVAEPLVCAVGGSWIATRKLIQQGDWEQIEINARQAVKTVDRVSRAAVSIS